MWHLPTRPATRWAAGAALIFTALAVPAFATGPPAFAAPVDQTPGQVTVGPGCPKVSSFIDDWDTNLTWAQAGGDYTGQDADPLDPAGHFEGNCNGTSMYMLDQPTETDQFSWHLTTDLWDSLGHGLSCHLWAYIPSQFAGDRNARLPASRGDRKWLGDGRKCGNAESAGI